MAHNQVNEIDERFKELKTAPGFRSYLVLNSDGIVIRWDNGARFPPMTYQKAVQHAHHIDNLYSKSVMRAKFLSMDPQDSRIENIRVRTEEYEMIISKQGGYTLAVLQDDGREFHVGESVEN
ncbi:hypothetical protein ACHAXS_006665 [Conticribra weissflogii]